MKCGAFRKGADWERDFAQRTGGVRVHRQIDVMRQEFESAPDVRILDFGFVAECKVRARFVYDRLIRRSQRTYCKSGEVAILATREIGGRGFVTLPAETFYRLLDEVRAARSARAAV
jgi:hypothetical protein